MLEATTSQHGQEIAEQNKRLAELAQVAQAIAKVIPAEAPANIEREINRIGKQVSRELQGVSRFFGQFKF